MFIIDTIQEEITFFVCFDLAVSLFQVKSINIVTATSSETLVVASVTVLYTAAAAQLESVCLVPKSAVLSSISVRCFTQFPVRLGWEAGGECKGLPEPRAVPGKRTGAGSFCRGK